MFSSFVLEFSNINFKWRDSTVIEEKATYHLFKAFPVKRKVRQNTVGSDKSSKTLENLVFAPCFSDDSGIPTKH